MLAESLGEFDKSQRGPKPLQQNEIIGVRPMRIAVFADIHANRQAFAACLAQARDFGAERIVLLGDYVGYGADPEWTVATVMELVARGAVAVRGNHDNAIADRRERLNTEATVAIEWTRRELGAPERRFLQELPLTHTDDERLYVHADASKPEGWRYVASITDAARSIIAVSARVTLCGHVHGDRQDDGLRPGRRRAHSLAPHAPLACGARLGGSAARRQSGGFVCHSRHGAPRTHVLPRAL
jgi:predicted phosphodiesterase